MSLPSTDPGPTGDDPNRIVTLVHGTWGGRSPFLDPNGPLQSAVKGYSKNVLFSDFRWSGRNRVSSRLKAATELGRHLKALSHRYRHAHHFVAAHSHGGNVALYSLRDPEVDALVSGVVCFSTPFLVVSERNWRSSLAFNVALPLLASTPLVGTLLILLFGPGFPWLSDIPTQGFPWYALLLGAVFLAVLVLVVPVVLMRPLASRWLALAAQHCDRLRFPSLQDDRLLIVRAAGDEASAAIAATSFIGWITSRVFEFVFKVLFEPAAGLLEYLVGDGLPRSVIGRWRPPPRKPRPSLFASLFAEWPVQPALIVVAALAVVVWAFLLLMGLLAAIPVATAMLLSLLGGAAYGSTSLLLQYSAESSPLGSHTEHLYSAAFDESGLAHTASYRLPAAVERAAAWITGEALISSEWRRFCADFATWSRDEQVQEFAALSDDQKAHFKAAWTVLGYDQPTATPAPAEKKGLLSKHGDAPG